MNNPKNFDDGVKYINGCKTSQQRDAYVELGNIEPGMYYIIVEVEYINKNIYSMEFGQEICITNYGVGTTNFLGDASALHRIDEVLHTAFISKINQNMPRIKISDMGVKGAGNIIRYESVDAPDGFNFIYIQNRNSGNIYVEEVKYKSFEGVQIMDNNSSDNRNYGTLEVSHQSYRLTVSPHSNFMMLIRTSVTGFSTEATCSRNLIPVVERYS